MCSLSRFGEGRGEGLLKAAMGIYSPLRPQPRSFSQREKGVPIETTDQ